MSRAVIGVRPSELNAYPAEIFTGAEIVTVSLGNMTYKLTLNELKRILTPSKAELGIDVVDNTADLDKPISRLTQTALNTKASIQHTHPISDVTGLAVILASVKDALENPSVSVVESQW